MSVRIALEAIYNEYRQSGSIDLSQFDTFEDFFQHHWEIMNPKSKTHVLVTLFHSPGEHYKDIEYKFPMTNEDYALVEKANPKLPVNWEWYSSSNVDMVHFCDMLQFCEPEESELAGYWSQEFPWPDVLESIKAESTKRQRDDDDCDQPPEKVPKSDAADAGVQEACTP